MLHLTDELRSLVVRTRPELFFQAVSRDTRQLLTPQYNRARNGLDWLHLIDADEGVQWKWYPSTERLCADIPVLGRSVVTEAVKASVASGRPVMIEWARNVTSSPAHPAWWPIAFQVAEPGLVQINQAAQ